MIDMTSMKNMIDMKRLTSMRNTGGDDSYSLGTVKDVVK